MSQDSAAGDVILSEHEAANFAKATLRQLRRWRAQGTGPAFFRISDRRVGYLRSELIRWARSQLQQPGHQAAA